MNKRQVILSLILLTTHSIFSASDLYQAIETGCQADILVAMKQGQGSEVQDETDDTPLMRAIAKQKSIEFITFLLEHHFNANYANSVGITPLMVAAKNGDKERASLLIAHNARVHSEDSEGLTPLLWAAWSLMHERQKQSPDKEKINLFRDTIKFLLSKGARRDHKDHARKSLVDYIGVDELNIILGRA